MTTGSLMVIRAGAGSGKTYRICEEIAAQIVGGLDPARVLATTFTRRAAAELKGRVQTRVRTEQSLPYEERLRLAERLELAMIGTVHSVGHRLVRRYALPLGLSPSPEVMEEDGAARHLVRLIGELPAEPWDHLIPPARRMTLDRDLHALVLKLLKAKRTNRIDAPSFQAHMQASGERVCELLLGATAAACVEGAPEQLYVLAEQALIAMTAVPDETKTTAGALTKLRRLASRRQGPWSDHLIAARLKAGKRSGAEGCLNDLRAHGAEVRLNSAVHADVRALVEGLTERVLALESAYETYKTERGLLDYNDLEVLFLRLLEDDSLAANLREEIQLVVVDEFQDTNPIQLALFLRLRDVARHSVWVGDPKQAIYGFRGADADLVDSAWRAVANADTGTLPRNYRSLAGLVNVVGELFGPVLGEEAKLEPVRVGAAEVMERWLLQARNKDQDAAALAAGVRELIDEGTPAGDIAVLARTHGRALETAEALTAAGIPALVARPGLLETRECAAAVAGLRVVADRYDGVAAASLLHLTEEVEAETPLWFEARVREVRAAEEAAADDEAPPRPPFGGDVRLEALEGIDARHADPIATLESVIEALGLGGWIATWGTPDVRAANLDALVNLARSYEDESEELGRATTVTGLLAWLDGLPETGEDTFPMPRGLDAVTVVTYHAAKGLEWPTVVLVDLDWKRDPDMWSPVTSGGAAEAGRPLEGRTLRYWPWPFGRGYYGGLNTGSHLEDEALASEEGLASSEAQKAESLRLLYVGMTRARDRLILAQRPNGGSWPESLLPDFPQLIGQHVTAGAWPVGETGASMRVRDLAPPDDADEEDTEPDAAETVRWFGAAATPADDVVLRTMPASSAEPLVPEPALAGEALPGVHPFPGRVRAEDWDSLGMAVHAYLAALPSIQALDVDAQLQVALRCLKDHAAEGVLLPDGLVQAGERFRAWVASRWPGAEWFVEVPVRGLRPDGGDWSGVVDLLLRLPDGTAIVIDHKSAPLPEAMWTTKAGEYTGQLAAYTRALASAGLTVTEHWVHLPLGGGVVSVGLGAADIHN